MLSFFYTRVERIWHVVVCCPCFKFWHSAMCCFCFTQGRECDTLHCMLSMISFTLGWREFDTVQNAVHVFLYTTEKRIWHSAVCFPCFTLWHNALCFLCFTLWGREFDTVQCAVHAANHSLFYAISINVRSTHTVNPIRSGKSIQQL